METDLRNLRRGNFVVLPTFRCNARCDHCHHECSPERRETIKLDIFQTLIEQVFDMDWPNICVSGGEPFLVPRHLKVAAEICRLRDRRLIVQTNGFWGRNLRSSRLFMEEFSSILQIGFSIDASHLREIPLEDVLSAMDMCVETGITHMSVSISHESYEELEILQQQLRKRYPGIEVVGWPIIPLGRAAKNPKLWSATPSYSWDTLQRSCGAQLTCSPIVHPGGELHACYRIVMALEGRDPLILGKISDRPLSSLLSSVQNPLFQFIIAFGGGGLGYLLPGSPFEDLLSQRYHNVCHFCYKVLSRADVVRYLLDLLDRPEFEARIEEGLESMYQQGRTSLREGKHQILVCNGKHCRKYGANYPIIHYLINRLTDSELIHDVEVTIVNCLKSCGKGPNLRVKGEPEVLCGITTAKIDELLNRLTEKVKI